LLDDVPRLAYNISDCNSGTSTNGSVGQERMTEQTSTERRRHRRHPLPTSIQFYHGPSQRDYPGRCVNVSSGGMLMYVPPNVPIQVGHPIRLSTASMHRPEFAGLCGESVDATVTRVDRGKYLSGQLGVAVRFAVSS